MQAFEEQQSVLTVDNAVEIGLNSRIYTLGGQPYTWNADAATLTKWDVDRTTLDFSVEGIISFASLGFSSTTDNPPVLISETEAYVAELTEGTIVEFNPTTMEITEVINVQPLPTVANPSAQLSNFGGVQVNGKIVYAINYFPGDCCEWESTGGATIGIFDPSSNAFTYESDPRAMSGIFGLASDENGTPYTTPYFQNGFVNEYYNVDPADQEPANTVLRVGADGSFDSGFELVLEDILNGEIDVTIGIVGFFDGNIILQYTNSPTGFPESFNDRFQIFGSIKYVSVDLATEQATPFTALDDLSLGFLGLENTIDGINFYSGGDLDGNALILRQNSLQDFEVVTTFSGGQIQRFDRLDFDNN
jgi:hypothetical protein